MAARPSKRKPGSSPSPQSASIAPHGINSKTAVMIGMKNMPATVSLMDANGVIQYVNPYCRTTFGYSESEMLGRPMQSFWTGVDVEWQALIAQLKDTGVWQGQISHQTKGGYIRAETASISAIKDKKGVITHFVKVGQPLNGPRPSGAPPDTRDGNYRRILENSGDGYFEVDLSGSFTFVNDAACRFAGRTREEVIGLNYRDYMPPVEAQRIYKLYNEVYKTGNPSDLMEYEIINKDGTIAINQTVVTLLRNAAGEPVGFCGVVRDLTEKKAMERALQESEDKHRNILANMEEGYYETDLVGNLNDFNMATCKNLGRNREELMGMNYREFMSPETADKVFRLFTNIYETRQSANIIECELIKKDGSKRIHEMSVSLLKDTAGKPVGFFGISRDRTEQMQLERALRESEESYRRVLELAPDAIAINDAQTSKYIQVNTAFCQHTGYTPEEIIGRTPMELGIYLNPEEDLKIQRLLAAEGKIDGLEVRFKTRDGEQFEDLVSARMIRFKGKRCALFVATLVTPLKQAHQALRESEESYRRVMELAPDAITISRISDGKYFEVNEAFCQQTGYAYEEVIGKSVLELNIYENPEIRKAIVKNLREVGRVDSMAVNFRAKDGTQLTDLIFARIIPFKGEECVLVVATVINKLVEAQQALRESEKRYREILESAPDAICLTTLTDGRYIEANSAFYQRTGYTPEETIGFTSSDLNIYVNPEDRRRFIEALRAEGQVDAFELPVRCKNGTISEQSWSARVIQQNGKSCLLVTARLIDDLKAAQRALMESEESYRRIMELAPDMFVITRVADGRIVAVNNAFCQRTGFSKEEAIGHTPIELGLYTDPEVRKRWIEILRRDGKVQGIELQFLNRAGSIQDDLFSAQYIRFKGEDCILAVITSITSVKQSQRALQEKEENQRTILETAPYAITIIRQSDLTYLQANKSFYQNTGYTPEEVIGHDSEELSLFLDPADRDRIEKKLRQHGRIDGMEIRVRKKDGSILETMISCRPLKFEAEPCLLFISADITALKIAQRALRESEESYRNVIASSPNSIAVIRVSDNRYVEINNAFTDRTGYTREEVMGKTVRDLNIYTDPADLIRMNKYLKRHGQADNLEACFRMKDGSIREALLSIRMIRYRGELCYVASTIDITAINEAQQAMRESENRFRAIFENAADALFVNDIDDGRFLDVNQAACRHLGYSGTKLRKMSLAQIVDPKSPYRSPGARNGSDHAERVFFESVHIRQDGVKIPVEVSSVIVTRKGRLAVLSIVRDVSERKKAEQELARYRHNLEQMVAERTSALEAAQNELVKREKLAVLGQLTATVSHELRNPLGVIRSSNFYLQRKNTDKNEKTEKHFRRIEEQVTLCDTIVADLLEYTRGRSVSAVKQELAPWIIQVIQQLQESEGVEISMMLDDNLPLVLHDREKMRRVLINVLDNAIQAVKEKAKEAGNTAQNYQPVITVKTERSQGAVSIQIMDNGIGMDEETCRRAFEPLFTTRARGTGIGLSNVKKIVEEHGGRILLNSRRGEGTRMELILPCKS